MGDHDPTGCSASENLTREIARYINGAHYGTVKRIALTKEQIRRLRLSPNRIGDEGPKEDESRYKTYVAENGSPDTWELDALEPADLQSILRAEIEALIEPRPWRKRQAEIRKGRKELARMVKRLREGRK